MFSTSGYFRGISCPFFINGLCERPYCHFRHVKSDLKEKNSISSSGDSYLDNLTDFSYSGPSTSRSLIQIESDIKKEEKRLRETESQHNHSTYSEKKSTGKPQEQPVKTNKYTGKPLYSSDKQKTNKSVKFNKYTGKPILHNPGSTSTSESSGTIGKDSVSENSNKYTGEPKHGHSVSVFNFEANSMGSIPEYNPTPICELKKRHVISRKYSLSLAETPLSKQEYDPLVNYSTSFSTGNNKLVNHGSNIKKAHTYHGELSYSDFEQHSSLGYKMADFGFSESEEEEEGGKWPYYKKAPDDFDQKKNKEKNVTFSLGDSDSNNEHNLVIAESDGKVTDSDATSIDSPLKKPADSKEIKNISVKNSKRTRQNKRCEDAKLPDNEILENGMKDSSDIKAPSTDDICNGDISEKVIKCKPVVVVEQKNDKNESKSSNESGQSFSLLSMMSQNMKSLTKESSKNKLVKTGSRVTLMKLNSVEHLKKIDGFREENGQKKDFGLEEGDVKSNKIKNGENLQKSTSDANVICTVNSKTRTKSHSSASCDSRRSSADSDRSKPDSSKSTKSYKSHSEKSSHSDKSSVQANKSSHSEKLSHSNKVKTHSDKSSHSEKLSHSNKVKTHSDKSSHSKKLSHSDKTKIPIVKSSHSEKLKTKDSEKCFKSKKDGSSKSHDEKYKSSKESSLSLHSDKLLKSHTKDSNYSSTSHINGSSNVNLHKNKLSVPHSEKFGIPHENVSKDDSITSCLGKNHSSEKQKTCHSSEDRKDGHLKVEDIHRHSDRHGKDTSKNKSEHSKNKHNNSSKNKHSAFTRHGENENFDSSRKRKSDSTDDDLMPKHAKKMEADVIVINSSPEKDPVTKKGGGKNVPLSKSPSKTIADINIDLFGEDSDDGGSDARVKHFSDMSESELCQYLSDSDFEDMNTYDECLRIFNEGPAKLPSSKFASEKKVIPENPVDEILSVPGKKRVAHHTSVEVKRKVPERPFSRLSAAQVMHNRFAELHRRAQEAIDKKPLAENSSSTNAGSSLAGKKRIAYQQTGLQGVSQAKKKTISLTASKTERRVAHTPTVNLKRPTIPTEFGSKVPSVVRQRYLNTIIDECLKTCSSTKEAFKRGQDEEMAVYNRSSSKSIYLNVAVNTIKRLRTEAAAALPQSAKQKSGSSPIKISHEAILGGKGAALISFTLNRSGGASKVQTEDFKGADLFNRLKLYLLTEAQLQENRFPRHSTDSGGFAVFYTDETKAKQTNESHLTGSAGSKQRVCIRCGALFTVFPSGRYAKVEECVFHWGKAWKKKVDRSIESRYNCCQGDLDSKGCEIAKGHVHESNKKENLKGYMRTIPSSPPVDGDYGVYAMDCEMVYTTAGFELARVSVVGDDLKPIYETFVQPEGPVVDYNTRFSGITEKDLNGVKTTLHDVQAVLLSLFTSQSILLGHSLESDFVAVKLIHDTVVDTSVVFPHRLGLPYKRALRNLMSEHIKKIIQDDVGGHDSLEDARACLELMQWKLKEDFRRRIH